VSRNGDSEAGVVMHNNVLSSNNLHEAKYVCYLVVAFLDLRKTGVSLQDSRDSE
jgi:hypothetical protein